MSGPRVDPDPHPRSQSRRRFLADLGTAAVGTVGWKALAGIGLTTGAAAGLAACGDSDLVAPVVIPLFSSDRVLVAGRQQRIPFGLVTPSVDSADADRVDLPTDDAVITVVVRFEGDEIDRVTVGGRVVDHDHVGEPDPTHQHADLFRYYPLWTELPEPGIYDLTFEFGQTTSEAVIQAFDPAEVVIPLAGDPFPNLVSPTIDRPEGVDQLCTRLTQCPFHTVSVDEARAAGQAMVVLVATPAYCSTAYCGPVLDTLIDAVTDRGDSFQPTVVHLEVWANGDEVNGNLADPAIRLAPAVEELGLTFEPSLFTVDAEGVILDRIDNVFDRSELDEVLGRLEA